ncbi:hypothetical protein FB451DRAFT_1415968 [Mycena latifolia]|nr:hypothetical protein FB451DRAFT_1415968 [Mycena latifolia]
MTVHVLGSIIQMQQETERMKNEVIELIATLSDGTISDTSSSIYQHGGVQNR